jgi:Carboxypeptidase regulatory-like domain
MLRISAWVSVVFVWMNVTPAAGAQTLYGSLIGNVTDSSGAVVPAATVQVVNTATGFVRETLTNERGIYSFSDLQPGTYEVRVSAPSFATSTQTGVAASANAVVRVNVQLRLSTVSETVTVASTATLQTDRSDVRAEITSRQLQDLPIPGNRNYQSLFKLIPGATPPGLVVSFRGGNPQESLAANVNGTTRSTNNTRIDGASNTHIFHRIGSKKSCVAPCGDANEAEPSPSPSLALPGRVKSKAESITASQPSETVPI